MMVLHHIEGPLCPLCEEKLDKVHPYMANWYRIKKKKYPNLHVSWGFRGRSEQERAFNDGKTKLHYPDSAHNKIPSLAIDLFQIDEDGVARWSQVFFMKLNAENEADQFPIKWGGNWKSLGDADHFQYESD